MKKIWIMIVISILFCATEAKAQTITGGFVATSVASTSFLKGEKPFKLGFNLFPDIAVATSKTIHRIRYGFSDNSVRSFNAYFLPKDWDVYVLYSKTLHTGKNYLGCGVEKMLKLNDNIKFFLFSEIGTDFQKKNSLSLSFGLLASYQCQFWKKK
jgi:hypothetical protein